MSSSESSPTHNISGMMNRISLRGGGGGGRASGEGWSSLSAKFKEGLEIGGGVSTVSEGKDSEAVRFTTVKRKKDFKSMERVNGRLVNVLQGLELHAGVFSAAEQQRIVDHVYELQEKGRNRELRDRTYSEPRKWMRGKGRVTIQLGCCYNYAVDKNGNPPGIIRDEEVDPITPPLKSMIKRMVEWRVLPPTCIPNSCIINIYDEGDCIPPHIDHHDFVRPFCTVSFLSECEILFGANLKVLGPGEFSGSTAIPLPVGSVLILSGNGADVAKHCVPAVPSKRISITFRKMDDRKLPFMFALDPELQNLRPLPYTVAGSSVAQKNGHHLGDDLEDQNSSERNQSAERGQKNSSPVQFGQEEFPSLVSPVVQRESQNWRASSQTPQASSHPGGWSSRVHNTNIGPSSHPGGLKSRVHSANVGPSSHHGGLNSRVHNANVGPSSHPGGLNSRVHNTNVGPSHPGSLNSRGHNTNVDPSLSKQSPASGEKPAGKLNFGQDDFPSLSSSAFSKPMRKPSRSLRQ